MLSLTSTSNLRRAHSDFPPLAGHHVISDSGRVKTMRTVSGAGAASVHLDCATCYVAKSDKRKKGKKGALSKLSG